MKTKQIIVMRKDLNMRKGKMITQGAHASMMFLLNTPISNPYLKEIWLRGGMRKICVSVDSEEELLSIHEQAIKVNVESYIITDAGYTEFDGPTKTCLALGPDVDTKIDPITERLKLL